MKKITCRCETSFDADIPEEIDLDAEPARLDDILEGGFLAFTCPSCGSLIKPEVGLRIFSRSRGLDAQVIPELERLSLYLGQVSLPKGREALVGYAELFERALVLKAGLDPTAVEIIKYYLRLRAEEGAPESADIKINFAGLEADESGTMRLLFHVEGLKEGEIAVLPLGMGRYETILAEKAKTLKTEPFDRIFAGPYRSIRILEAEASL